jgi:hypothetical protein
VCESRLNFSQATSYGKVATPETVPSAIPALG